MTTTETVEEVNTAGVLVTLVKDRDTKNTLRYAEEVAEDATPSLRNLYLNKTDAAILGNPERIEVVITAAKPVEDSSAS